MTCMLTIVSVEVLSCPIQNKKVVSRSEYSADRSSVPWFIPGKNMVVIGLVDKFVWRETLWGVKYIWRGHQASTSFNLLL
jgi:hypothetical protein